MANIGTLTARINADTTGLEKGLRTAERRMDSFARKSRRAAMVAGVALAGIGAGAYHLTQMASEAKELSNVVNQSFGEMADSINDWAKETGDAMNRSTYQMREFAAFNQAILKPLLGTSEATANMSKNLTKLSVDMGSFFEVADKQAFEAIQSGLMGMVKPLRQFGIDMTQATLQSYALRKGIDEKVESMDQAEKVQLRYNYLMENTTHIQGDAVRTADSFANRMKGLRGQLDNLARNMGKYLLPYAEQFVGYLTDQVEKFNALDDAVKANILRWTVLISGILAGVVAFGLLATAVQLSMKALIGIGTLVSGLGSIIFSWVGLLALGAFLLYAAWDNNWLGIRETVQNSWEKYIKPVFEKIWEWLQKAWDWSIDIAGTAWDWLKDTTWAEKWEDVKGWMTDGWEWSIELIEEGSKKLWNWIKKVSPGTADFMETSWNWTLDKSQELNTFLRDTAIPWVGKSVNTTWNWLKGVVEWTGQAIKGEVDIIPDFNVDIKSMTATGIGAIADALDWVHRQGYAYSLGRIVGYIAVQMLKMSINAIQWLGDLLSLEGSKGNRMAMKIDELVISIGKITWQFVQGVSDSLLKAITGKTSKELGQGTVEIFTDAQKFIDFSGRNLPEKKAGGLTGNAGVNQVAGVVHGGEWVMPAWMVKKFPQLTSTLESMRSKGYKDGGGVGLSFANMNFTNIKDNMSGWLEGIGKSINNIGKMLADVFNILIKVIVKTVDIFGEFFGIEDAGQKLMDTINDLRDRFNNLFTEKDSGGTGYGSRALDQQEFMGAGPAGGIQQKASLFSRTLEGTSKVMLGVMSELKSGMPMVQSMMEGFKQGGIVGIITSLITNSKSFQKLLATINPILQLLADTLGVVLLPIVKIIEPPLRLVAEVLRWVAGIIIKVWNGIVDVLDVIIFWTSLDKWKVSMKELDDNLENTSESAKQAADAMRNIPRGVKVMQRAWESSIGTKSRSRIPSAANGATVKKSGLVNVHAAEVIRNQDQQGGDTYQITIGDVYGINDLERKIIRTMDKAKKKKGKAKYGVGGK
ncbi:MAG: hypothetical protein ACQEQF_00370 [Bacillota bacterium]